MREIQHVPLHCRAGARSVWVGGSPGAPPGSSPAHLCTRARRRPGRAACSRRRPPGARGRPPRRTPAGCGPPAGRRRCGSAGRPGPIAGGCRAASGSPGRFLGGGRRARRRQTHPRPSPLAPRRRPRPPVTRRGNHAARSLARSRWREAGGSGAAPPEGGAPPRPAPSAVAGGSAGPALGGERRMLRPCSRPHARGRRPPPLLQAEGGSRVFALHERSGPGWAERIALSARGTRKRAPSNRGGPSALS